MSLTSILLAGAALAGLSGAALAADAPVTMVEPEPAEYVRICDVYGKGYFYIPGTETCLQIGGYIRFRVNANDGERNNDPFDPSNTSVGTTLRARIDYDVREETEMGTLRGKIRTEANQALNEQAGFELKEGFIQIGGLMVGLADSLWTNEDGGISDGLLMEEVDWAAGDYTQQRISYTHAIGKVTGIVSLEDDGDGDWKPDVLAKLAYAGDKLGAYVMGVYDEDADYVQLSRGGLDPFGRPAEIFFQPDRIGGADGAFVVKGAIELKDLLLDNSQLKFEGHYAFDPSRYAVVTSLSGSAGLGTSLFDPEQIASRYQIGAGYSQELGKWTFVVSGVYGETEDLDAGYSTLPGTGFINIGAESYYGVGGDIVYNFTDNFSVTGEVTYRDFDLPAGIDDFDRTFGILQVRRNF